MSKVNLDPTVMQFKIFINNHPELIKVVRKEGRSWQEYYEKWALLGEEDPFWEEYKEEKTRNKQTDFDFLNGLMLLKDHVDFTKIDKYMNQLNKSIVVIQDILKNYKGREEPPLESKQQFNSFNWFQD